MYPSNKGDRTLRDFQTPGRSSVFATNGMCATSHPLAAQEAIGVLKQGGNALDAAIAGAVLLGICEPQMTGIGGDCFALVKPAGSDEVFAWNGSGTAPAAANADDLRALGQDRIGETAVESVTIPGAIDAFCQMSEKWGRIGIDAVLQPAIHYAEAGVPVAPRVAADWANQVHVLNEAGQRFYSKNGAAYKLGEVFAAPGQAEVLRRIAKAGRDGFYLGQVAEDIIASLKAQGGCHAEEDLAGFSSMQTEPVSGAYKEFELFEHPPNGQGATAILILNILKNFDLAALPADSAARIHIEAEAAKLAYDARNRFIADPRVSVSERMLSQDVADQLAGLIRKDRVIRDVPALTEAVHKDTIYITVTDRDGMAVSLIYSIFHGFGSGIASEKFGILLQNRGCGFNLTPGHPNEYGGGKRPMHTIIPGMIREGGRVTMPFGVMGGQFQPTGHARLLTNLFDYGMELQAAIDFPRAFADQGQLKLEAGISETVARALADLGHDVARVPMPLGGAQAIYEHESGVYQGASDPRKDGIALGY
jgi:gamma-glutamyltranspeptidase/glutathione hydrolase